MFKKKLLSTQEQEVLDYIDEQKYTTPIMLRVQFGMPKQSLNRILQKLSLAQFIASPAKGFYISVNYYEEHEEEYNRLCRLMAVSPNSVE